MRATLTDGRVLRIAFRHYRYDKGLGPGADYVSTNLDRIEQRLGAKAFRLDAATECWLTEEGQPRTVEGQGFSGLVVGDEWDIEEGRRRALARAIQAVLPRNGSGDEGAIDRERVWKAYFERGANEERNRQLKEALANAQVS